MNSSLAFLYEMNGMDWTGLGSLNASCCLFR